MDNNIQISNLSKNYGKFKLGPIDLNIPKGAIVGFVGENGAGKTTTIKLILNIIKRNSGEVKIFGMDNIKYEQRIKEDIGVVLDEGFFFDEITPKEINKIMKNTYKKWDEGLFSNYLHKFEVAYDKSVKSLSTGMKMKLSIAVALSHSPKLLILDEPTSGLDPIARDEILDIFQDFILDEEKSILFSTHITSDLDKIADYISFIHKGNIIFTDEKDMLKENYAIIKCSKEEYNKIESSDVIGYRENKFGSEILVKDKNKVKRKYPNLMFDNINSIEEIMIFYVRGNK